jgi:hypothetical protein
LVLADLCATGVRVLSVLLNLAAQESDLTLWLHGATHDLIQAAFDVGVRGQHRSDYNRSGCKHTIKAMNTVQTSEDKMTLRSFSQCVIPDEDECGVRFDETAFCELGNAKHKQTTHHV